MCGHLLPSVVPHWGMRGSLTKEAGELGHTGHKAVQVNSQATVAVSAREQLGQLVVELEACGIGRTEPSYQLLPNKLKELRPQEWLKELGGWRGRD